MQTKEDIERRIEELRQEIVALKESKNSVIEEGDLVLVVAEEHWSNYTYVFRVKRVGNSHFYGVYMDEYGTHCPSTFTFEKNKFIKITI